MLGGLTGWLAALTIGKKIALVSATVLTGATVYGVASTPSSTLEPTSQQPVVEATPQQKVEIKKETDKEPVEFKTQTTESSNLDKGDSYIQVKGVKGEKTIVYEVTYTDGVETDRKIISEKITKQPVNQIKVIGTFVAPKPQSNCDPNYSPCVPNVSYDLDCPDIGFSVTVIGSDPHRFDADYDGYGCESY